MGILIAIVAFIVIFSSLIIIHEFGHFIFAKLSGVGVKEFGLGMPPKILRFFRAWNTDFTLNWIPFGGFVRLKGQDDFDPEIAIKEKNDPDSFEKAKLFNRILIICGGVLMNFILALVLLFIAFKVSFSPLTLVPDNKINFNSFIIMRESFAKEKGFLIPNPKITNGEDGVYIREVIKDTISDKSGLLAGDKIIRINNQLINNTDSFFAQIYENTKLNLNIIRNNELYNIAINKSDKEEKLGLYLEPYQIFQPQSFSFVDSIKNSFYEFGVQVHVTVFLFGQMLQNIFIHGEISKDVAGPVGIAQLTYSFSQEGILALIVFAATLSMSLGVINIMPFPALDGGRLLFMLIEGIFRKPVAKHIEEYIHKIGFLLLMILILVITWNDITRLIFN